MLDSSGGIFGMKRFILFIPIIRTEQQRKQISRTKGLCQVRWDQWT